MKQIEASELRVGNLVDYYEENHTFEVLEIHKGGIRVKDNEQETWIEYECFSPIELTEEWLLKFGFHKWGRDDIPTTISFEKELLHIATNAYFEDGKTYGWMWEKMEENNIKSWVPKVKIRYVHQLQNLYFALTGKELTINT